MRLKYLLILLPLAMATALAITPFSQGLDHNLSHSFSLVPPSTVLNYHGGPLLTGPSSINLYLICYGTFYKKDRTPITDFFASFAPPRGINSTVLTWWNTILSYKDKSGNPVSRTVKLAKQLGDGGIMTLAKRRVTYAYVGDPHVECPGLCAWPYAIPAYGPPGQALVVPNGIGSDGTIINVATILAGAATNPFKSGYFQGDALAPLEAVTACPGIFGDGAYPGYPGDLKVDKISKASYNAYGVDGR
ncbi:hypothetical protein RHSIM_Rhsim13G0008100 [Rhododendron simsii]|uniref:Uncharacterized protein n=1 Tax=Rhododendron simsii TaxID=118357 RepID=A0A834FZ51_RHOSS|nr:hypothetical protein RHSIM_Rhsim13G0008100 [Rhododendron simsii]